MANQIRFEVSANNDDLDRLSQQLELLKRQQIELARQAQAGEKTIAEAIKLQSDARKEQLGIEKLLATARKANAEEQKSAINNAITAQNNLVQSYQRELGMLEKLRAELREQKKAREQATDRTSIDQLTESIKGTQAEINKLTGATDKFKGSNGFWQDMRRMVVAAFAVDAIIGFGKELFNTQVLLDSQRVALRNVVDNQKDYQQSLSFLTNLGDKYGQSIIGLTKTYTQFIASSRSSGLELKERQAIYESIIKAGSALTLSNEQIEGSLLAVSQMFSKGKVSAEELRGQLGERLPGAFGLFAKGLNVTEQELDKMLKKGEVLSSEALPKFAKVLEETYGAKAAANITTFGGAWNRLTNNITLAVDKFSTANQVTQGFAKGINFLADNLDKIWTVIRNVTIAFVGYEAATKGIVLAKTAWNLVTKAGLILQGEAILLTKSQAVANIALTEAELEAAAAAQIFNNTLLKNPFLLVASLVLAAVTAYQLFSEEQSKLNENVSKALAPLEEEKIRFNNLANAVLDTNIPLEVQYQKLLQLKAEHPDLLKNVTNLSEAEKILKKNKIETNVAYDYRLQKLNELKAQFPEQLKGITDLETAEKKLGNVKRLYNNDFLIRAQLLENEVKLEMNAALIKSQITEKLSLQREIFARKGESDIFGINKINDIDAQNRITKLGKIIEDNIKRNDTVVEQSNKKKTQLNFQYEEEEKKHQDNLGKIGAAGSAKIAKEKIDSIETLSLIEEKTRIAELEKTEVNEQKLLAIEKDIAIKRINESKASATKKTAEILKIEEKFKIDLDKLTDKYDKEEADDLKKSNEERIRFSEGLSKALEKIEEEKTKKILAYNKKLNEDKKKLDEEYKKESEKNQVEQLKLTDGLRLLDRISHAKNAAEILKIEKEEKTKILLEEFNYYQKKKFLADIEFQKVQLKYGEDTIEYKKALIEKTKADTEFTQVSGELTKVRIDNIKTEQEKQAEALGYMMAVSDQVFGMIGKSLDKSLASTTDLVKQAQIKNQQQGLEIAKQGLSAVASLASGDIPGAIMKGIGIVFNGLDLIINGSKRKAEAAILQSRQVLQTYLDFIEDDIDTFINSLEEIKDIYGELTATKGASFFIETNLNKVLQDLDDFVKKGLDGLETGVSFINSDTGEEIKQVYNLYEEISRKAFNLGISISDLVNAEANRGEKIKENYDIALSKQNEVFETAKSKQNEVFEEAKSKENEYYNEKISNINKAFDEEIRKINQKYDYESIRATQQYNAQTLAITAAGTAQLEALITNEASLASVRKEFADKRLAIEQAFPLAAIAITEGMSDAEIKSINDSITARDAALAKLQGWYNTELTTIVNAEGQKRKEYSATELIQNTIQANLDKAALKFQGEEIQRAKERADAIVKAEGDKDLKLQEAKKVHNVALEKITLDHNANIEKITLQHSAALEKINADYTKKIEDSYKLLTALLTAQQKEIETAMANTAAKGTEEYQKLEQQLYRVKAALDSIKGVPAIIIPNLPIVPDDVTVSPTGFATGTDRLPNMNGKGGVDSQVIRADVGERILTKEQNNTLRRAYGRDLGNKEVVKILTQTPKFVSITPTGDIGELVRREAKMSINLQMQGLSREITDMKNTLSKDLNNLPITQTSFDNRGFTRGIKTRTSFTEQKKNKYFGG